MRLWVERLRWGLLAAAVLLICVVVVLLGYGRYRAVKAWQQIVKHSGATLTHEAHEVTYSQAIGGRTAFTIHAADAVPHGDGRYTLHNVVLLLYGAKGSRTDRISGAEFDYDEKSGVARALGEVHMDLQAPAAFGVNGHAEEHAQTPAREVAESPQTIHVKTSGLVYMRKLGVAATDQQVELAYEGFHGYAKGAEFDSSDDAVHLLADVRVDGMVRGAPATLTATKADLAREDNEIRLMEPRLRSGAGAQAREASASMAMLHLRKDGSVELAQARGDVALRSGTRTMRAAAMDAEMSEESLLREANFSGGVRAEDSSAARPMSATARSLKIACDKEGSPASVVAEGAVRVDGQDRSVSGRPLQRQMAAERVVMTMHHVGGHVSKVSAIEATGSAWVKGESLMAPAKGGGAPRVKTTELAGDELHLTFGLEVAGRPQPELLTAKGRTRLEQTGADGTDQSSSGDELVAHFAQGGGAAPARGQAIEGFRVIAAEQSGHVHLQSRTAAAAGSKQAAQVTEANAERATFDEAADQVKLVGHPVVQREDAKVSAETILLTQSSGDAEASGSVSASFVGAGAGSGVADAVTHAIAQKAYLSRTEQTLEFRGTDAQPARMWKGASQIEAASLLLNRGSDGLIGRPAQPGGLVRAVFASSGEGKKSGTGPDAAGGEHVVRVSGAKLDYAGATHEAVFSGGVRADDATAVVRSARAVVFLSAADKRGSGTVRKDVGDRQTDPLGGSVEKIVLSGGVRLDEPGRSGTGEQLLYTAARQEFVLTGTPGRPPHIVDEKQGSVTGATLLFGAGNSTGDSTIVVAGEPASHGQARGRVHTETAVKP